MLGFTLLLLFGYNLVGILWKDANIWERVFLGFLLGNGIFTFLIFVVGTHGVTINTEVLLFILIVLFLITLLTKILMRKNKQKPKGNLNGGIFSKLGSVVLFFVLFLILSSLASNLYFPIREWDALALYDMRAKIIFETGQVSSLLEQRYFVSYPLLTSLSHVWAMFFGFTNPKFVYSLFYLSLIITFFFLAGRFLNTKWVLIIPILLLIAFSFYGSSLQAYTNLPYAAYFGLGILYLYLWLREKTLSSIAISSILIGLSTWTRGIEPLWVVPIILIFLFGPILKEYKYIFLYPISVLFFRIPWVLFQAQIDSPPLAIERLGLESVKGLISSINLEFMEFIVPYMFNNVIAPYLPIFLAFLLSIYSILRFELGRDLKQEVFFQITTVLGMLAVMFLGVAMYFVWQGDKSVINYAGSVRRISMIFVPILLLFIAVNVKVLDTKLSKKHEK